MRLTQAQKQRVLQAAPAGAEIVRVGDGWCALSNDKTAPPLARWTGLLVHSIDASGRVWWCAGVAGRRRRDVLQQLELEVA